MEGVRTGATMADQINEEMLDRNNEPLNEAREERRQSFTTPPGPGGCEYNLTGKGYFGFHGNDDQEGVFSGIKHAVQGIGKALTEGAHHGGAEDKDVPFKTSVFGKDEDEQQRHVE
ncbi:unnamed protein product, partial [Mesorhabditis spiculigera]